MDFYINGNNYSSYVTKYKTGYRKVLGGNSYTTLDGTYYEDVIARKVSLTVEFAPINSSTLSDLIEICQNDTLSVTYFDPKENSNNTLEMIPDLSIPNVLIVRDSAIWGDIVLSLEEK